MKLVYAVHFISLLIKPIQLMFENDKRNLHSPNPNSYLGVIPFLSKW